MRLGPIALAAGAIAALACVPADAGHARGSLLSVRGAPVRTVDVCGARRAALIATPDSGLTARVEPRSSGGARTTLTVHRCTAAGLQLVLRRSLAGPATVALRISAVGDYRVLVEDRPPPGEDDDAGDARARAYVSVRDPATAVPVSFRVANVNRSRLPCASDGLTYTLRGRLIGPHSVVVGRAPARAVTLYVHEFSFGRFFWSLPSQPAYDYAALQARAGHVSVVFDRLGYDTSDHPPGTATCLGAQADMVHQVVMELRAGGYTASGAAPRRFARVALAGHSVGAGTSELAAYSFGGVDALVVVNWADQGFTAAGVQAGFEQNSRCASGGEPAEAGSPSGYSFFVQDQSRYRTYAFYDAEPRVADAVVARRNRDPCGDARTLTALPFTNLSGVSAIKVPVLVVFGRENLFWDAPSAERQQVQLYSGSRDATGVLLDRARHALPFERVAPRFRAAVGRWLARRGF